jgi:hypothetical protein
VSDKTYITKQQAREWLLANENNYDNNTRLYGVISGGDYDGQIDAIKSEYYLDRSEFSKLYLVTTRLEDLIQVVRIKH